MAVRGNKAGREIGFKRCLWSWIPCHWKGWALIAGIVAAANVCIWVLLGAAGAMNTPDGDWPFLALIPFIGLSWWLAERHSPPKANDR
jgi:hypothetical protein